MHQLATRLQFGSLEHLSMDATQDALTDNFGPFCHDLEVNDVKCQAFS